jgi:hypothetical protein
MRAAIRHFGIPAALLLLLAVGSATAQERGARLDRDRVDFVLGNFQFALLHELAHVAIFDMEPPIIGPEEYAADYLATVALLRPLAAPRGGAERWVEFAITTADAFAILWQLAERTGASSPYWDSHALSIQRFYSVACLIYGSDPARFASVPELIQMPAQRAASCQPEYTRAVNATDWLLSFAASRRDASVGASMAVRYEEPRTRTSQRLVAEIQASALVEWTLQRFHELVTLDDDATLVFRVCSEPEAAWIAEQRELVVCYELLELYYLLSAEQHRDAVDSLLNR